MARHLSYRDGAGSAGHAGTVPPASDRTVATGPNPRTGIEAVDEPLGGPERPEFEPSGTGVEGSTTTQTNQELVDFAPARGSTYLVDEIAVSLESNGAATVSINGDTYGEFTGATDVTIPFDGGKLPYGGHIRVFHRSTDGNTTTTKALVIGREV
jgi:hypothetical protein